MRHQIFILLSILTAWPASAPATPPSSELQRASLAQELEMMSLTTGAATLIRDGTPDQALALLEKRLTTSVERAETLSAAGARLPEGMSLPSLSGAPDRAREYAETNGLADVADRAESLSKAIRQRDDSVREPPEMQLEIIGR